MDKKGILIICAGVLVTAACFIINVYLGGTALVILFALIMALLIMQDSADLPEVAARLSEDAKSILLTNSGNADAVGIHVTLVPADREFDIPVLHPDASFEYPYGSMIPELKAVIAYTNAGGKKFSGSFFLSALKPEYDPLKPAFPLFGWK
ncbi:MAG: hypothetical protein WC342_09185 [Methanoregula sp.]|jgi:hypothetical protein